MIKCCFVKNADAKNLAILTIALLAITFVVQPLGEFCMYDDWSFARSLQIFVETGKIQFLDWTSMPLIGQILLAAPIAKIFGFSFTALRIFTIIMGFIGIWGTYFFFKEISKDSRRTMIYTLAFFIQAVFLNFIYSFDTDVPFYSILIWSAYFLAKYLNKQNIISLAVGTALLIYSILIRDIGIALAIAYAIASIVRYGANLRNIALSIVPMALGFAAIYLWKEYLVSLDALPALYNDGRVRMMTITKIGIVPAIVFISKNIVWFATYFGLFLSPLFILKFKDIRLFYTKNKIAASIIIASSLLLLLAGIASDPLAAKFSELLLQHIFGMTYWGNVHNILEPTLIRRTREWNLFAIVLASIGLAFFLSFITIFVKAYSKYLIENIKTKPILLMSIVAILVYSLPVILAGIYVKYLIFIFPFMIVLIDNCLDFKQSFGKTALAIATVSAMLILYFSVATTHDVLAEERARWAIAEEIHTEMGVPTSEIDGGICFNGWYEYSHSYQKSNEKNWWWVLDDKYLVADGKVENYQQIKSVQYRRYLPPFQNVVIYGLKRID